MADFDADQRRLVLKLVYYGPDLSGKTTNLMRLHDMLRPELKGEMMTLETRNDRTLFFDLLPLGFRARACLLVKFMLYTVPGQVAHDSTRKAVLSRADGVVVVADSQRTQGVNNAEAFQNLADNVQRVGRNFDKLPLVVQFNKRDMADVLSEAEVAGRWSATPWPVVYAVALMGEGVRETFRELLLKVYDDVDRHYRLADVHGIDAAAFVRGIEESGGGNA